MWTDDHVIWEWDATERLWRAVIDDEVVEVYQDGGVCIAVYNDQRIVLGRMCVCTAMREVVRRVRRQEL